VQLKELRSTLEATQILSNPLAVQFLLRCCNNIVPVTSAGANTCICRLWCTRVHVGNRHQYAQSAYHAQAKEGDILEMEEKYLLARKEEAAMKEQLTQ
jgi:hypothetical protein